MVQKITKTKIDNGIRKCIIKWEDYSSRNNTWEPEANIPQELQHEFHTRIAHQKRTRQRRKLLKRNHQI